MLYLHCIVQFRLLRQRQLSVHMVLVDNNCERHCHRQWLPPGAHEGPTDE